MRPEQILHHFVFAGSLGVHKARLGALVSAAAAVIDSGSLVPAHVGRSMAGGAMPKHGIKRVDRLLGNEHLHAELPLLYGRIARTITGVRPVILVDWTKLDGGTQAALVAAVAHRGRALPILTEVHPMAKLANPHVEAAFLEVLARTVLPAGCKPILVTDAGFKNPWFKRVLAQGWDFVGRTTSSVFVQRQGEEQWRPMSTYASSVVHKPKDYGEIRLAKGNPLAGRLVTSKAPPKGRHGSSKPNRKGIHRGSDADRAYRKRAKTPASLFTSLRDVSAVQVERLYATRMQIEESFRVAKSHRFGWSMEDTRSKNCDRLAVLFLLASLAMLALALLGTLVEHLGLQRHFQANTVRTRRVLSLVTLGRLALGRPRIMKRLGTAWLEFAVGRAISFSAGPLCAGASG
ncbi:MAG: IS4 family transposase [Planctomycetota bacterium]